MNITTNDNITIQSYAFEVLENITGNMQIDLYNVGKCGNKTGKSYLYELRIEH
jgi:hypothetical protein